MRCQDFRDHYSDYADGLLDEAAEVACRQHLAECSCCRRLDAAYRLGHGALQHLPRISPSIAFRHRLMERLCQERLEVAPALRQWSGVAGAVLLAAAVAVATVELSPGHAAPSAGSRSAATGPAGFAARSTPAWKRFVVHFVHDSSPADPKRVLLVGTPGDSTRNPATPGAAPTVAIDWISP